MEIIQTLSEISSKFLNSFFWELLVLLDELEKVTSSTVLENDPEMVPCFIPVIEFQDMPIFKGVEHANFVKNLFPTILLN